MHRTSCYTLLTVPDSINSTGTRILHHLLPWLPTAFLPLFLTPHSSLLLLLLLHPSSATPASQGGSVLSHRWCDTAVLFELVLKRQGVFLGSFSETRTKEQHFPLHFSEARYFHNEHSRGNGAMIPQLTVMK